ncbi:MAG: hypothetical protein KGY56_14210, partial [Desulfobacterales bacterium]|nr:hypothetical protein [Desulfobacterales bacterium]
LACLCISLAFCMLLFFISLEGAKWIAPIAALFIGSGLLIEPAVKLLGSRQREDAMALFNKASYFPVSMLMVAFILII